MGKRQYNLSTICSHEGCKEENVNTYDTHRAYMEAARRRKGRKWFCCKHNGHNLNPECMVKEKIITCIYRTSTISGEVTNDHTWDTGSSFTYGAGWNANAEDFPIGTEIHEIAMVKLPNN